MIGTRRLTAAPILVGALVLCGCATTKPESYGFQRVVMRGQDLYCAPRQWVVPPVVPQEAADDPNFPLYKQFLDLPERVVASDGHSATPEVCITQAQWPEWLMMRNEWNRDWPVTPSVAEKLATEPAR